MTIENFHAFVKEAYLTLKEKHGLSKPVKLSEGRDNEFVFDVHKGVRVDESAIERDLLKLATKHNVYDLGSGKIEPYVHVYFKKVLGSSAKVFVRFDTLADQYKFIKEQI